MGMKALKHADIYTGVNIIAGDNAQSPFNEAKNDTRNEETLRLLNKEPKENQSHYMMMYAVVSNLILTGNVYIIIHRNTDDSVSELEFEATEKVNVIQDLKTVVYRYDDTMPYGSVMYK